MDYSPKYKLFIITITTFLVVGFATLSSLSQTNYCTGWDSYFYMIQAKSWLVEGAMHSPSASLVHPLLAFTSYCTSDYILAYKITVAFLSGLFGALSILVAFKWSKQIEVVMVVGAIIIVSPFIDYIAAQYPKHLLGLVFFMGFLLSLSKEKIIYSLALLVLNFFGHKLTFGMAFIAFAIFYATQFISKKVIIGSLIAGVSLILVTLFVPGLLSIEDIERFSSFLSLTPTYASFEFISFIDMSKWWIVFTIIMDLFFLATFGWLLYSKINKKPINRIALTLTILGIILTFPFLHWAEDGLALRMYLSFVVLIPVLISTIPIKFPHPMVPSSIFIASLFLFLRTNGYHSKTQDPPYRTYEKITKKLLNIKPFNDSELIIGHKSLAEFITYETGKDVLPWQPEYEVDDEYLWRIVTDIIHGDLRYYLPNCKYFHLTPNYYLVKETDWQNLLKKARSNNDFQLLRAINTWRNPNKIRPNYLLKNKRE